MTDENKVKIVAHICSAVCWVAFWAAAAYTGGCHIELKDRTDDSSIWSQEATR